jgi:HEAT repeat protein
MIDYDGHIQWGRMSVQCCFLKYELRSNNQVNSQEGGFTMSESFETLVQRLNSGDDNVRSRAIVALGNSGDAQAIKPLLTTLLNDNNLYVREYAAEALQKLGWQPTGGEVSAAYFVALRKYNSCVGIGAPAVKALIRELNDGTGFRRKEAIRALGKIGGPAAIEAIKELVTDPNIGGFAQDTLKNMGESPTVD